METAKQKDAVVYILAGQSNAVGHNVPMEECDYIAEPLKNVFGLSREQNQSYDNKKLNWSGYTSYGMNLAEAQDNSYSVANCLARLWQDRIDGGEELPDLYIIHIAIGAQGMTEEYMWYPDREKKKIVPGVLGTVDISLHPFTVHILSLIEESFIELGKSYEIMGFHWRGGENDTSATQEYLTANLENLYKRMFEDYRKAVDAPMPIVLHKIVSCDRAMDFDPTGEKLKKMYYIDEVFEKLEKDYKDIKVFDVTICPMFIPDVRGNGIFIEDVVHFTPEVNKWVAEVTMKEYINKNNI